MVRILPTIIKLGYSGDMVEKSEWRCPDCDAVLEVSTVRGLRFEQCPRCSGVLLDKQEVVSFVRSAVPRESVENSPIELDRQVIKTFSLATSHRCPRDGTQFEIINYAYDSNILLERCPSCEVLWIKQNQLSALAQFLKGNPKLKQLGLLLSQDIADNSSSSEMAHPPPFIRLTTFPVPVSDFVDRLDTPYVVMAIIALNCIIFLLQYVSPNPEFLLNLFSYHPSESLFSLTRLFSHQFLHLNLLHVVSNMWVLWIFGDNVESRLGHAKFLAFYLISGAIAALGFGALLPHSDLYLLGASGSIAAVIGAYVYLYPKEKLQVLFWNTLYRWTVWKFVALWMGAQFLGWLFDLMSAESITIAHGVHVIGFFFGLLVVALLARVRKGLIQHVDVYQS